MDLNPRIALPGCVVVNKRRCLRRGRMRNTISPGVTCPYGRLVWVEHPRKNSVLFVKLLEQLRSHYRRANRIVLILDNYRIHKSQLVERWLENNPKFQLLFQPTYHPWVNVIERLWKAMHDTVTRNHRCLVPCSSCVSMSQDSSTSSSLSQGAATVSHI